MNIPTKPLTMTTRLRAALTTRRRATGLALSAAMLAGVAVLQVSTLGLGADPAAADSIRAASSTRDAGDPYEKTTIVPTPALIRGTGEMKAPTSQRATYGTVGVASYNVFLDLTFDQQKADLDRLTSNPRVDVIGFQEAADAKTLLDRLPTGWAYYMAKPDGNGREVPVAYRTTRFTFVSARTVKMHDGMEALVKNPGPLDRAFPPRFTTEVVLTETKSGQSFTVFDTHTNQRTEAFQIGKPGVAWNNINAAAAKTHFKTMTDMVKDSKSRYVVVVGDLNWDYVADQIKRPAGFVEGTLGTVAVSSYESLGLGTLPPSAPDSGRYIDYVMLTKASKAAFTGQDILFGYNSDHRPVLATIALN